MSNARTTTNRAPYWLWLSMVILLIDQVLKAWALAELELFDSITVTSWLTLQHGTNPHGLFTQATGANNPTLWLPLLGLAGAIFALRWLQRGVDTVFLAIGTCLLIGGLLGNTIDWPLYGHAITNIRFEIYGNRWLTNLSDIAMLAGVIIIAIDLLIIEPWRTPTKDPAPHSAPATSTSHKETDENTTR